jgi:hypothetical protein
MVVIPACAYRVGTNIRLVLFAPMPQGIKLLRHQKYAKMLCQSSKGPFTPSPYTSKKQWQLFCLLGLGEKFLQT